MAFRNKTYFIILGFLMQLIVFGRVAAEPIEGSNNVLAREISPPDSKTEKDRPVLLSISPLIAEGEIVGAVAEYDDPTTKRPVDCWELYDTEGDLVAVTWFDNFGIQRMAVDRGLVEESDTLEGVFVLVVGGVSV